MLSNQEQRNALLLPPDCHKSLKACMDLIVAIVAYECMKKALERSNTGHEIAPFRSHKATLFISI